jgi:hypothetical protein
LLGSDKSRQVATTRKHSTAFAPPLSRRPSCQCLFTHAFLHDLIHSPLNIDGPALYLSASWPGARDAAHREGPGGPTRFPAGLPAPRPGQGQRRASRGGQDGSGLFPPCPAEILIGSQWFHAPNPHACCVIHASLIAGAAPLVSGPQGCLPATDPELAASAPSLLRATRGAPCAPASHIEVSEGPRVDISG